MNPIRINLEQLKNKTIPIGREGENEYTVVRIDCGKVFAEHPQAEVSMKVKPPKGIVYPVTVERDGNEIIWTVKDYDLASKGDGQFQLTFTEGNVVCKTAIGRTLVLKSLVGDGPAPTPIDDWMKEAQEALDAVEDAEVNQPIIGVDGYWYTWNKEAGEYQKTDTKAEGQDGHTPVLTSSKSGKTTTIYADGDQLAQIQDGQDANIDDTSTAADKVWSAAKSNTLLSAIQAFNLVVNGEEPTEILKSQATYTDKTSGGIEYTWNSDHSKCLIKGTRSGTSFNKMAGSSSALPTGMVAGGTYIIDFHPTDEDIVFTLLGYVNGTEQGATYISEKTKYTIPSTWTGLEMRLQVIHSSAVVNENVDCPAIYQIPDDRGLVGAVSDIHADNLNGAVNINTSVVGWNNGYIGSDGYIENQSANKEKYSDNIYFVKSLNVDICFAGTRSIWVAVASYDIYGVFIQRDILINKNSIQESATYIAPSGTGYIRIMLRTFDESYSFNVTAYCDNNRMSDRVQNIREKKPFQFVNHMGYNDIAPENTLPAFALSAKKGYKAVELDIRFTSDNVPVCIHDATINRTSDGTGNVSDYTFDQLQSYDFGSWKSAKYTGTKIPSLKQALTLCKMLGMEVYIEIKDSPTTTQAQNVVSAINSCGMMDKVALISFYLNYLVSCVKNGATCDIGYLSSASEITAAQMKVLKQYNTPARRAFISSDYSYASSVKEQLQNAGIDLMVYTVDSTETLLSMPETIFAVTTDNLTKENLEDYYE